MNTVGKKKLKKKSDTWRSRGNFPVDLCTLPVVEENEDPGVLLLPAYHCGSISIKMGCTRVELKYFVRMSILEASREVSVAIDAR